MSKELFRRNKKNRLSKYFAKPPGQISAWCPLSPELPVAQLSRLFLARFRVTSCLQQPCYGPHTVLTVALRSGVLSVVALMTGISSISLFIIKNPLGIST